MPPKLFINLSVKKGIDNVAVPVIPPLPPFHHPPSAPPGNEDDKENDKNAANVPHSPQQQGKEKQQKRPLESVASPGIPLFSLHVFSFNVVCSFILHIFLTTIYN